LGWSQYELLQKARVGVVTVHQLEAGSRRSRRATIDVIRHAFEAAGVEFLDQNDTAGPGVRLRKPIKR
jgi:transcriptional regulator with XRE-family HTH domain